MRRTLIHITIALALGAIVTIAVAWGCALGLDIMSLGKSTSARGVTSHDQPRWNIRIIHRSGASWVEYSAVTSTTRPPPPLEPKADARDLNEWVQSMQAFKLSQSIVIAPYWSGARRLPSANQLEHFKCEEDARGWPMLCLMAIDNSDLGKSWQIQLGGRQGRLGTPYKIPLRPIWPGFLGNTVFYGAALWVLFCAWPEFRRWRHSRRLRHGLCPWCAYPIGTGPQCTECGKPLRRKIIQDLRQNPV